MQHVIIGTAGHIDHGKTTLIKALTGRETDTLREEKERGISINLGFTYFDLPSGRRAGIVDVPGHEKFIKNMLAGIGGIDLVLLVIAADEGVMPQTKEHLNILELLDIKNGIIVINKIDMVDEEWLKMVKDDIRSQMKGTFLEKAPMVCVSSITKEGIDELTKTIDEMTKNINERDEGADFRIPVDRVFSVSGFGTVITGTLISGKIHEGDNCEIYVNGIKTKIRGIQVHENQVKEAFAGQRVAVNLANVKKDQVKRGDTVAKVDSMKETMMVDCRMRYLKDSPRELKNHDRIKFYHGTSEILGRVVLLDKKVLKPGDTGLVQIRLEGPLAAKRGDKYVIRSYSPMITIGGGTILEPNPMKEKVFDDNAIQSLLIKEKGDVGDIVEKVIESKSSTYPDINCIKKETGKSDEEIEKLIETLINKNSVYKFDYGEGTVYIHNKYREQLRGKIQKLLEEFHSENPLKFGIPKEELKSKIFSSNMKQKLFDCILNSFDDLIKVNGNFVSLKTFEVVYTKRQQEIRDEMLNSINDAKFQPPKPEDIFKFYGREEKTARIVFASLVDNEEIVKISEDIYITSRNLNEAKGILIELFKHSSEITAAQYRDAIGASRKYAVAVLEYFDSIKLTKRIEDKRVLFKAQN